MFQFSIFLLSAAALGYEVLLMRLFSIAFWHHFAATVISLALLGYGASGTFLSLTQDWLRTRFAAAYYAGAAAFGIAVPACFAASQRIPFNPLALVWEAKQWYHFAAVYVILSVPFFFVATCIGLSFRQLGDRIPRLYRADLLGAGVGALGIVLALHVLRPSESLRWIAVVGFAAAGVAALGFSSPARLRRGALATVLTGTGVVISFSWPETWIVPRMSEYKALSQALRVPGAVILEERWSPLGRVGVVASPQVPFRHAPGLSLSCPAEVPEQLGLFSDGTFAGVIEKAGAAALKSASQGGVVSYEHCLPTALPYQLLRRPRVLVLGSGGGTEVLWALRQGAERVDAVELDPEVVGLVRGPFSDFAGNVYGAEGVEVHTADARAFISGSRDTYDLIQLSLLDAVGTAGAGAHGASESYVYTVEALEAFLAHLAPGGVVAITRWLEVPPRGSLKLFATAVEALERMGVSDPGRRMALVRTWNTVTLLVRNGAFEANEIERIRTFSREWSFDISYLPGIREADVNRYNILDEPYLYQGTREILGTERHRYLRRYKFYIVPATDDRPYFFRFFKWRALPELLETRTRGGSSLLEWGYLLGVATLLQAVGAGVVLILLPLWRLRSGGSMGQASVRTGVYFASLGLGFLFVEVALLKRFVLVLGHPVYAASAVLASFLVFAGLGSGATTGRLARRLRWGPAQAALVVAAVAVGYQALLPATIPRLAALPLAVKSAVVMGLIAPLAFFMGMPFPLGLRAVASRSPAWIPWAWGLNGFASVWSAALAALLSFHLGFFGVVLAGACLYLSAAWAARSW